MKSAFELKYGMSAKDFSRKMGDDIAAQKVRQREHDESLVRPGRDTTRLRQCDFAVMTADGWK